MNQCGCSKIDVCFETFGFVVEKCAVSCYVAQPDANWRNINTNMVISYHFRMVVFGVCGSAFLCK